MRLRALLLLVAYASHLTPFEAVPQVLAAHAHQTAAAFPCARHACGCRNAAQCLLRCCCAKGGGVMRQTRPVHPVLAEAACHRPADPTTTPSFLRRPHTPPLSVHLASAEFSTPHHAAVLLAPDQVAVEPPELVPRLA